MKSQMTIGKKLFACVGGLLALTLATGIYGLVSISALGNKMATLGNSTAKKLSIAGDVSTSLERLSSDERGMVLRAYMKDTAAMEGYKRDRGVVADHLKQLLSEYAQLSTIPETKQLISELQGGMESADEFHKRSWELASAGTMDAAAENYRNSLNPQLKKLIAAGEKLPEIQLSEVKEASADGAIALLWSRWITCCVLALCLGIGLLTVWVVRQISDSLRNIVNELRNGGEQVASASGQIASTSQSLSQGSSEQAASLEEISASMEEMTAMAKRNTENSGEASGMMSETAQQVDRSNAALNEMVVSMSAIKTSSEKVAKIIKTIEEIAFQTNILALNAAVEAARAGEAGMGFAVVADEVRNLAQRSALAAKDTAALIEEAISSTNQGAEKLDRVAVAIRAITESAKKVKGLVEEVSESSKQSTIGINQTSTAVSQVSKVTQTAAASAEETAAASEELSAQSQTVRELVLSLSAMVDSGSSAYTAAKRGRSAGVSSHAHKPAATKQAATTAAPGANSTEDDPFPMDTPDMGNFRSF